MGDKLRLAIGVMGNAASLLLFCSPILTFWKVMKKKSTEGFSCVPYVVTLLNCLVITWYGLPIVSFGWENITVVSVNGLAILLQLSYILTYLTFATSKKLKIIVIGMSSAAIFLFSGMAVTSVFIIHDHRHRKIFVGCFVQVFSVALFAAPLVAVKGVIQTRSVEFMPFYLSFFTLINCLFWTAYGLISRDIFLLVPNAIGTLLGVLQLTVYFMYNNANNRKTVEEPHKVDEEKNKQPVTAIG